MELITQKRVITIKKVFCVAILILIIIPILSGCNMYAGERPNDYPSAKWISESPDIWFMSEYGESDFDYGEAVLDGETIEIMVFFDYSNGIYISAKSDDRDTPFTKGFCTFRPDKLTVKIDEERDNFLFLNGQYETITFNRISE